MRRLRKQCIGLGLFAALTVCTAMSATDDDEMAFAEAIAMWATYAHEVRTESGLDEARREISAAQASGFWHQAYQRLMRVRPDLAKPDTPRSVILDFALEVVKRHAPEDEQLVREEFDQLRAATTLGMLQTIGKALDAYQMNEGVFPASGNRNLVEALINGGWSYLALPEGRFDQDGQILDDWRRPIVFLSIDGHSYTLYSLGPNGADEGGAGDDPATSWP